MTKEQAKVICIAHAVRIYDPRKGVNIYDDYIYAIMDKMSVHFPLANDRYTELDKAQSLHRDLLPELNLWLKENDKLARSLDENTLEDATSYLISIS